MKTLKSNSNLAFNVPKFKQKQIKLQHLILLIFLLVLIGFGVLPGYLQGGKWSWADLARVDNQYKLLNVRKTGITIPGWQMENLGEVQIGDKKWFMQNMIKDNQKVTLLLLPQSYYLNHPGVEWTDLSAANVKAIYCNTQLYDLMGKSPKTLGLSSESTKTSELLQKGILSENVLENLVTKLPSSCQRNFQVVKQKGKIGIASSQSTKDWTTDSPQKLTVSLESGEKIETMFLRGRNREQTFAILQWYAWKSGGNFASKKWFFTDLWAQLQKHRAAWVAVSVRIPIEILGNIDTVKPLAESIVKDVQNTLSKNILTN